MTGARPIKNLLGWTIHRLVANYWSLALGAALLAPVVFAASLHADRNGITAWLLDADLQPVSSAETARDVAALIAGIDAALLTLYFSISLIVLTIAAGNLGVRLIDRWLAKPLVRVSIAGLSFTTIHAVLTMAAIDADAKLAETPLLTFAICVLLLVVNIVMTAVAVHDLGRTMFVDKAIDALSSDGRKHIIRVVGASGPEPAFPCRVDAPRSGYIEGVQLDQLADALEGCGKVKVVAAPGQHVLEGERLLVSQTACRDEKDVLRAIPIGPFRSDSQGAVFQIRLLVEIAARALSPAVNDFYTAIAAVDALTELASGHVGNWVEEGQRPVSEANPLIGLPGQDFKGLFDDPMAALRQAASPYPSVSIRLIGNLRRLIETDRQMAGGLVEYLCSYAQRLHDHARQMCDIEFDRIALDRALEEIMETCAQR